MAEIRNDGKIVVDGIIVGTLHNYVNNSRVYVVDTLHKYYRMGMISYSDYQDHKSKMYRR